MQKSYFKSIVGIFVFVFLFGMLQAQTVTLTFTGRDASDHYVPLNSVSITNQTKGWSETLEWPDTVLVLQNEIGIDECVANGGFALSQNNPNPFNGTTDVKLTVADVGVVMLEIADGSGRIVGTFHETSLQYGTHQFRITLSSVGTYVMTAHQNGKTLSIKMVCNRAGNENRIEYAGVVEMPYYDVSATAPIISKKHIRTLVTCPFDIGDQMEYVGIATINGTEEESVHITQALATSQTFFMQFIHTQSYVTTMAVSNIMDVSATSGGEVTIGSSWVTSRGVCWSSNPNPTIADSHTTNGNGYGSFTSNMTGLTPSTTYYVRAYANSTSGTIYGNEVSFTTNTSVIPTVTTSVATNITDISATCGGEVIADGGAAVTARGVCWSHTQNPTIEDSHTTNGSGLGSFTSDIQWLMPSTRYYMRAYATNNAGTSYGEEVSIFTQAEFEQGLPCPETPTVTDIDGNVYNTVQIGTQCWMRENLKTKRYADTTSIPEGSICTYDSHWYYPDNDSTNESMYGLLYNWNAMMHNSASSSANPSGVQGVCPTGWHVPSKAEWTQLTNYVSSQSEYSCNFPQSIAKSLASSIGWFSTSASCSPGNDLSSNNSTGFRAMPAGVGNGSYANNLHSRAIFWSSTQYDGYFAYYIVVSYDDEQVAFHDMNKYDGYSVRCLRD